jgi:hypothetical protein
MVEGWVELIIYQLFVTPSIPLFQYSKIPIHKGESYEDNT